MAGIYIHIPFCRQKCNYCDFFKVIGLGSGEKFHEAIKMEALLRKNYLEGVPVQTIYLGGGTPSVLKEDHLSLIINSLHAIFQVNQDAEITLEANPDDLTPSFLHNIKKMGINRLSIGVQSFDDEHLKMMNRRHDARQAIESIENSRKAGFTNLSVDLIYGLPGLTMKQWKESLSILFHLPVGHLSAYHLTYHEGTLFHQWRNEGMISEIPEKESITQFNLLIDMAEKAGFEHYEISNFTRTGCYSRHNSSYWSGETYLGLGPSAHSYNVESRRWNAADLVTYLKGVENDLIFWEEEKLSESEKFNEYILTRMRTKWGISVKETETRFGREWTGELVKQLEGYLHSGKLKENNGIYSLTREGLFVSDDLISRLMII